LFAYSGVQHIMCCVFVLFVFVLCLVYPMFPVSLDCPSFHLFMNHYALGTFLNHFKAFVMLIIEDPTVPVKQ